MEENYSVYFALQLELQGQKMLPHQLEMEKTRIETVWVTQNQDEIHALCCMSLLFLYHIIPPLLLLTVHTFDQRLNRKSISLIADIWPEAR